MGIADAGMERRPFQAIAGFYSRYRPPWPEAVFTRITERFSLDGKGRLLDLGCGPGNMILSLARHVEEAVGVDAEPDMLAEARAAGFRLGLRNVTWMQARAEDLADADFRARVGQFRLVTMGMSFHWMDRERVLAGVYAVLLPGGGLAIIGQDVANTSLRRIVDETLMKFLGEPPHPHADRPAQPERHEDVVARTPFTGFETVTIPYRRVWNVDQIIGWVYSFSDSAYFRLGDRRPQFERMLRDRLFALDSTGVFSENVSAEIILAWKT